MSPVLVGILEAVVPLFVKHAEVLFPKPSGGQEKYSWVQGMVNEALAAVAKRFNLPSWTTPLMGEFEVYLKQIVEDTLAKIDPPDAPAT